MLVECHLILCIYNPLVGAVIIPAFVCSRVGLHIVMIYTFELVCLRTEAMPYIVGAVAYMMMCRRTVIEGYTIAEVVDGTAVAVVAVLDDSFTVRGYLLAFLVGRKF